MAARGRKPQPSKSQDEKQTTPVEAGYVRVTSPMGSVTDVPESVLAALVASGYTH